MNMANKKNLYIFLRIPFTFEHNIDIKWPQVVIAAKKNIFYDFSEVDTENSFQYFYINKPYKNSANIEN